MPGCAALPTVTGGGSRPEELPLLVETVGLKVTVRCGFGGAEGDADAMLDRLAINGVASVAVELDAMVVLPFSCHDGIANGRKVSERMINFATPTLLLSCNRATVSPLLCVVGREEVEDVKDQLMGTLDMIGNMPMRAGGHSSTTAFTRGDVTLSIQLSPVLSIKVGAL